MSDLPTPRRCPSTFEGRQCERDIGHALQLEHEAIELRQVGADRPQEIVHRWNDAPPPDELRELRARLEQETKRRAVSWDWDAYNADLASNIALAERARRRLYMQRLPGRRGLVELLEARRRQLEEKAKAPPPSRWSLLEVD